jgi:hypothetical protein
LPGNSEIVNVAGFATADHTKNILGSTTVTALGGNLLGTYVLQVQGYDSGNASVYQFAGVIVLDGNGNVTSGEFTVDDSALFGSYSDQVSPAGSSYFLGPDGRGTVIINPKNSQSPSGALAFNLAFLSNSHLLISAAQLSSSLLAVSANGTMDLQSSAGIAALSGGYAFVLNGTDLFGLGPTGIGGVFNVDNLSGNPNNISGKGTVADQYQNNGLGLVKSITSLSGVVSAPDSLGAFSLTLTDNAFTLTSSPLSFTGYMIDATHIQLIENDSGAGSVAGPALAQGSSTGAFTQSSFSGTYVFGLNGVDFSDPATLPNTFTMAGVVTSGGAGILTNGYADSAFQALPSPATFSQGTTVTGTFNGNYGFGPLGDGRYQATLVNFKPPNVNGFYKPALIFYLSGSGSPALVLAAGDPNSAIYPYPFFATGIAYPQATGSLTFSGGYGLSFAQENGTEYNGTGLMSVAASSFTGTVDVGPSTAQGFTGTFSSTSCSSTVSGCFATSFANSVGSTGLQGINVSDSSVAFTSDIYMIDSTQGFFVENDLAQQSTPLVSLGYFSAATLPQQSASAAKKNRHK